MRFGVWLAPLHQPGENPRVAIERDLQICEHLDVLGFDELWVGEHHSAGFELIAAPEIFLTAAAERTKSIQLGTGVTSLPYHHPLIVADRMVLLHHLSRGRAILGVGPGALASDAHMMGLPLNKLRNRVEESLDVLLPLLRGEVVSAETDWFTLQDARLQLLPRTPLEVAVAAGVSPAGPRVAGRFGVGMLSIGARSKRGVNLLGGQWDIVQQRATEFDTDVSRETWRVVGPMHIAATREEAFRQVEVGLPNWLEYFRSIAALPFGVEAKSVAEAVDALNQSGFAVIGTVDDAIAHISALLDEAGGFGTFVLVGHEWASTHHTKESYELFARHVVPALDGSGKASLDSKLWVQGDPTFRDAAGSAIVRSFAEHED